MDQLHLWQERNNIDYNAYEELLSILGSTNEAEQSHNNDEIFTENAYFPQNPIDQQIPPGSIQANANASILGVSEFSLVDNTFQKESFLTASSLIDFWPINTSLPVAQGCDFFSHDCELFQDTTSTHLGLFDHRAPYPTPNEPSASFTPRPRQSTHANSSKVFSGQRRPPCIRCWKRKKAVIRLCFSSASTKLTIVQNSQRRSLRVLRKCLNSIPSLHPHPIC